MKKETRKAKYRGYAIRCLAYYLQCGFTYKQISEDGRAGGNSGGGVGDNLMYSIGSLTSTTPKNPAKNILIQQLVGNKKLATFTLEELRKEVEELSTGPGEVLAVRGYNKSMQTISIPGEIPSKKNSYGQAKNGARFKVPKVVDFEELVAKEVMVQGIREIKGEFSMDIAIYTATNRCDLDNMETTIIDALQNAGVYENDKLLVSKISAKWIVSDELSVRAYVKILPGRSIAKFYEVSK